MNVAILYLHVTKRGYESAPPPEYYLPFSKRWINTYKQFTPTVPHEVHVVSCGHEPTEEVYKLYEDLNCTFHWYLGRGSDIGACQLAMQEVDAEFVICMSTPVYFWKSGWLERLVDARNTYGDGLYGPMASYHNLPHIRTSCWAVTPETFKTYPHLIDTREKCSWAESFDHNNEGWQISKWYASIKKPAMMVTWDEVLPKQLWRHPPNIFRRGDQSNCIVWDQHVDVYNCAHYHERLALASLADELTELSK